MRSVSLNKYYVIKEELDFYKNNKLLSEQQYKDILALYSIKKKFNFMTILLLVGSVLVGLGILTFIGSNWQDFSKITRFVIILTAFLMFNGVSYKLYNSYPKTSKSFMYIAIITFGAGIFLIGQMFNFGGDSTTSLLLWTMGIISYVIFFKDKVAFVFSNFLILNYINEHLSLNDVIIVMLILIPVFYYINSYLSFDKVILFLNNLLVLNTLILVFDKYVKNTTITALVFFIIGLAMYYIPITFRRSVFKLQGNLIYGISGFILTFPSNWGDITILSDYNTKVVSIIFTIVFLIYLLLQTRMKNLLSLPMIFIIIMRYYFDSLYDFMPKSIFFIIGGLILLAFGYYFERFRKESRGEDNV